MKCMEKLKIVAALKKNEDEIKYLIIEFDADYSLGYFLFGYKEINQVCEFDMWFQDLETAKNQALYDYDVHDHVWRDYKDFIESEV